MKKNVLIIHYTPLVKRRMYVEQAFPKTLELTWVTEKSLPEVPLQDLEKTKEIVGIAKHDLAIIHASHVLHTVFPTTVAHFLTSMLRGCASFLPPIRAEVDALFDRSTLGNTQSVHEVRLMHFTALELASQNQNSWSVVLEDDSVLTTNGWASITEVIDNSPGDLQLISLSKHALRRQCRQGELLWQGATSKILKEKTYFTPNAYMIRSDFAKKMVETIRVWGLPTWTLIDFTYLALILKLEAKIGFLCPSPVLQGSEVGTYESGFQQMRSRGNYPFRRKIRP